jgi:uncharacterized protein (TIGR02444 family)
LALQEHLCADINVLLFCAWLGWQRGVMLSENDLVSIGDVVGPWQRSVVSPLRSARQFMRGMPDAEIIELRKRISTEELEAEKIEQTMLFGYAESRWPSNVGDPNLAVAKANLLAFIRCLGDSTSQCRPLTRVVEALLALQPVHIAE